jgi:glycosyltransferase involved in cell wall biosynthesis
MKIFHVITSLKIGGAESALINFLENDSNNEHTVAYFYPGLNLQKLKNLKIKTYKIKGLFYKYDPIAYFKLKKIIKKNNPDIIHSALWSANILSKLISNSLKIPVICDLHSNIKYDGIIRQKIEILTTLKATKYIAVSKSVKDDYLNSINKKAQITVIPNAIDTKKIEFNKNRHSTAPNVFTFGTVGRLEKIKSYDLLIKSFAQLHKKISNLNNLSNYSKFKQIKLIIVGNGNQKKELIKLAKKLNIYKHTTFTGLRTDPENFYPKFNCFVISSKSEGLSIALLEALSYGLPIITTSQQSTHDVIENNTNGFIIKPDNEKELSQALEKIYLNTQAAEKISLANKKLVKRHFSIERVVADYNNIYQNVYKNYNRNQPKV